MFNRYPSLYSLKTNKRTEKDSKLWSSLFVILIIVIVGNVEVTELVGVLVRGNNTEPVAELVLLEELLCKVLEVALGEVLVGGDGDLIIAAVDDHLVGETTSAALNLDAIVKELLEGSGIEDLVTSGAGAVNDKLVGDLLGSLLITSISMVNNSRR
jgi:hypothetical protein